MKVTVSVPEELLERANRAIASGTAIAVGAYVADALRSYGSQP